MYVYRKFEGVAQSVEKLRQIHWYGRSSLAPKSGETPEDESNALIRVRRCPKLVRVAWIRPIAVDGKLWLPFRLSLLRSGMAWAWIIYLSCVLFISSVKFLSVVKLSMTGVLWKQTAIFCSSTSLKTSQFTLLDKSEIFFSDMLSREQSSLQSGWIESNYVWF